MFNSIHFNQYVSKWNENLVNTHVVHDKKNQAKINTSNFDNDSFQKFEINLILVIFLIVVKVSVQLSLQVC